MTCENWPLLCDKNVPSYVQIYDIVFQMIRDGELKEGDSLPGENILAAHWKVSRSTVRMAVRKLEEDGYLYKMQGKRTTVATRTGGSEHGLQWLFNPCVQNCVLPITDVRTEPELQICGRYVADLMGYSASTCVMISMVVEYFTDEGKVASSFMTFHNKMLEEWNVSPEDPQALRELAARDIYRHATRATLELNSVTSDEGIAEISGDRNAVIMEEVLIGSENKPIAYCKHWMNANWYRFAVDRKSM